MMSLLLEAFERAPLAMMCAAVWSVAAMVFLGISRGRRDSRYRGVWWTLPLFLWCLEAILHYPLDVDHPTAEHIVLVEISLLISLLVVGTLMLPGFVVSVVRGRQSAKSDTIWALGVGSSVSSVLLSYARWTTWAVLEMGSAL